MFVILIGESGVGKSFITNFLKTKGFNKVISHTSRERLARDAEDAYYFVTKEVFEEHIKTGFIIEHTLYGGNYYGVAEKDVVFPCVIEAEQHGYKVFKDYYGDDVIGVYIYGDKDKIRARKENRGDTKQAIASRELLDSTVFGREKEAILKKDISALEMQYDIVLDNTADDAYLRLYDLIKIKAKQKGYDIE